MIIVLVLFFFQSESIRGVADIVRWSDWRLCRRNASSSCQYSSARRIFSSHRWGCWRICRISMHSMLSFQLKIGL